MKLQHADTFDDEFIIIKLNKGIVAKNLKHISYFLNVMTFSCFGSYHSCLSSTRVTETPTEGSVVRVLAGEFTICFP